MGALNNNNMVPKIQSTTICSSAPLSSTSAKELTSKINLINGKKISETILTELKEEVTKLKEESSVTPGLALLIGSRRDSQTYVNMKKKACEKIGITSYGYAYA